MVKIAETETHPPRHREQWPDSPVASNSPHRGICLPLSPVVFTKLIIEMREACHSPCAYAARHEHTSSLARGYALHDPNKTPHAPNARHKLSMYRRLPHALTVRSVHVSRQNHLRDRSAPCGVAGGLRSLNRSR